MNLTDIDKKYLVRGGDCNGVEIVKSKGSYIQGKKGKKYIDFTSGWCVGNFGWGNEEIKKSIKQFEGPDYVGPSYLYKPWVELAKLLAEIAPGNLIKSFRATGGTEAVEIALRTANAFTGRHKFISIEGSYHGDSIAAMSIGASEFQEHQKNLLFHNKKIKTPLNEKAIDHVESLLKSKDYAAVIMEPVICNLAVHIPEKIFIQRILKACKKYQTLFICDEVATGFGRTGFTFGAEMYDIEPDIMTLGKAITGGYAPMGAVLTTERIAKSMNYESSYYSTYGWHPLSVAAAIANLKFLKKNKKLILNNCKEMSDYFAVRLQQMPFRANANIRIAGLAIGVEFDKKNYAQDLSQKALEKGVLIAAHSDHEVTLFPALTIQPAVAKKGLDILEECCNV